MSHSKPVLIDTDPGLDDALALVLALRTASLDVQAITVVSGNVPLPACTANVLRILETLEGPSPHRRSLRVAPSRLARAWRVQSMCTEPTASEASRSRIRCSVCALPTGTLPMQLWNWLGGGEVRLP